MDRIQLIFALLSNVVLCQVARVLYYCVELQDNGGLVSTIYRLFETDMQVGVVH